MLGFHFSCILFKHILCFFMCSNTCTRKSWAKPSPAHLCAERRYKGIFASQGSSCVSKQQKKAGYKVFKTYFVAVSPFLILVSWYQTALLQESRPKEPLKDPEQIRHNASYYPVLNSFLSQVNSRYSECSEIKL